MELGIEYRTIQCDCGLVFAIPETWAKQKEKDHTSFYCPNCKSSRYYPQESEKDKVARLERQLQRERNCCQAAQNEVIHLENRINGYKGYAAKLRNERLALAPQLVGSEPGQPIVVGDTDSKRAFGETGNGDEAGRAAH